MLRRFLHGLEQGVERLIGQHVDLVDDIHLVAAHRGQIGHLVPQIADVIHAVVGGGVHFHNVHDGAGIQPFADLTFAAGVGAGGIQTVDRLGKNFGTGGLAGAAGSGEQVGVADASRSDLVLQRRDNGRLAHHIGKSARPPFAVQRAVHGTHLPFLQQNGQCAALLCIQMQACRSTGKTPLNAARFPA